LLLKERECDNGDIEVAGECDGDTEVAGECDGDTNDGTWNGGKIEAVIVSKQ
jgi:hypothetical protein